ncbi:MAG: glycoside hydrolase [Bacteroidetes bacterium]|nr:MAG: glycoside hydrolase [Bacteroidota bacterium]
MSRAAYIAIICSLLVLGACQNRQKIGQTPLSRFAIEGVSFVGMPYENKDEYLQELTDLGINWISQMPFCFQRNGQAKLYYGSERQWWGEKTSGISITSQLARDNQISCLIKPQIWMGGIYTGHMTFSDREKWKSWEQEYSKYILCYARLADSLKCEALCIGTELQPAIEACPEFWPHLIDSIRQIYHGKLTYAANWDEYRRVPFWKQLDWVGVNAYFPLSDEKTPKTRELIRSWSPIRDALHQFSDSLGLPIVFTEIGYKSVDQCAMEPWNPGSKEVNMQAQKNAYEAFYRSFSNEKSWFRGYFLWKWFPDRKRTDTHWANDYTPQSKEAEYWIRNR